MPQSRQVIHKRGPEPDKLIIRGSAKKALASFFTAKPLTPKTKKKRQK